jgi:hypothetical protein
MARTRCVGSIFCSMPRIHVTSTDVLTYCTTQTIAKILASTAYIHTLPTELQEKATASWMRALHIVFQCQMVCPPLPEFFYLFNHCGRYRLFHTILPAASYCARITDSSVVGRRRVPLSLRNAYRGASATRCVGRPAAGKTACGARCGGCKRELTGPASRAWEIDDERDTRL